VGQGRRRSREGVVIQITGANWLIHRAAAAEIRCAQAAFDL